MRKVIRFTKASAGFLKALVGPREPLASHSANGHAVLKNWDGSPEEVIIRECEDLQVEKQGRAKQLSLFCFEGPHSGQLFYVKNSFETIGKSQDRSLVLTPAKADDESQFHLLVNGRRKLIAETGNLFKINGEEEQQCDLFDYDELELLGNRFVVLDVTSDDQEEGVE